MLLGGIFNCQSLEIAFSSAPLVVLYIQKKKKKKEKFNSTEWKVSVAYESLPLEKETFDTESWKTLGLIKYHFVAK